MMLHDLTVTVDAPIQRATIDIPTDSDCGYPYRINDVESRVTVDAPIQRAITDIPTDSDCGCSYRTNDLVFQFDYCHY